MHNDSASLSGVVSRSLPNGFFEVRLPDGSARVCFVGQALREAGTVIGEGDHVWVGAEEGGIFRGEIRGVRPEARAQAEPPARRASLIGTDPAGLKPQDQRIDREAKPGWPTGGERLPQVGDVVYCTAGLGTVVRLLGRTGDGSLLLELRVPIGGKVPFFAASSNVLMAPPQALPDGATAAP